MAGNQTLDPGPVVDSKSHPMVYDDHEETSHWQEQDQLLDLTISGGDKILGLEMTLEDMTDAEMQDRNVDPPDESCRNDASALTDARSGMQVDSASSSGDTDSTLGSDIESSTISLRESVFGFVEENGRRYHSFNEGKYVLPNDEEEQGRLDLQHHLFMLTFGALHIAPLPSSLHNVLDIGTGTGLWAIEFAQDYPMARVLGSDLSPIQPEFVPPNCTFEVSDAEEPWTYTQKFDYIHGRALLSCFRDPAQIIHKSFSALSPYGILEMQDPQMPIACLDSSMDGRPLSVWTHEVCRAAALLGRPVTNSQYYGKWMREAGFVDIVERHFYWPLNTWPRGKKEKLIGMWAQQNLLDGVQAMSMAILTRGLKWSREEVEVLLAGVRDDLRNHAVHSYVDVVVFYGRKPGPDERPSG